MRAPFYSLLLVLLLLPFVVSCQEPTEDANDDTLVAGPVKVAVLTGKKEYDEPNFELFVSALQGSDIEHLDVNDFAALSEKERDDYEVIVFYDMEGGETPSNPALKTALERLTESGQGVVLMHHAILAWEKWSYWDELVGHGTRNFGYEEGIEMDIEIANTEHPITEEMDPFAIIDEGYILHNPEHVLSDLDNDSELLMTVEHIDAMPEVAWTRTVGESRVFCIALGHDNRCWANPSYQQIMKNAIEWAAGE